jgi:hypothetical protein
MQEDKEQQRKKHSKGTMEEERQSAGLLGVWAQCLQLRLSVIKIGKVTIVPIFPYVLPDVSSTFLHQSQYMPLAYHHVKL